MMLIGVVEAGGKGEVLLKRNVDTLAYGSFENGKFQLELELAAPSNVQLYVKTEEGYGLSANMVAEPGDVLCTVHENRSPISVQGGKYYKILYGWQKDAEYVRLEQEAIKQREGVDFMTISEEDRKALMESSRKKVALQSKIRDRYVKTLFVNEDPWVQLLAMACYNYFAIDTEDCEKRLTAIEMQIGESYTTKNLWEIIKTVKEYKANKLSTSVNSPLKEFKGITLNGKQLTFGDVVKRNKYTLLDFWGPGCGPCLKEFPNTIRTYKENNEKGFEVVTVNCYGNKKAWSKITNRFKFPWINLSDISRGEKEYSAIAISYGATSLPANFLIDQKGKIIAKNLKGEELDQKIAELLK